MEQINEQVKQLNNLIDNAQHSIEELKSFAFNLIINKQDNLITEEEFLKQLTNLEKNAYDAITTIIKNEGNISISQFVEAYGISRPVFTNLLQKMSNSGLAQVINQGTKGTYIKFL